MKTLAVPLTFLVILASCTDIGQPGSPTMNLRLIDRNGNEATVFRSGEDFDMRLTVTNQTGTTQSFTWGPPRFVFQVMVGDSLVSSSTDGFAFITIVERASLINGQSDSGIWRAPNSAATPGRIILPPGQYKAMARFGGVFDEFGVLPPKTMSFTVVP